MHSALYTGRLEHWRSQPRRHAFGYRVRMLWLDLAELDEVFRGRWLWSTRRVAPGWVRRADFLGDPALPLDACVRERVQRETGWRPDGAIRLLAQPRIMGSGFNPVSFYYCYPRNSEAPAAIVAEITNTPWGERHAYVLDAREQAPGGGALRFRFRKDFHVSPFMPMDMDYDWSFAPPGPRLTVRMENIVAGRSHFGARLELDRRALDGAALAGLLLRQPFGGWHTLGAIYWLSVHNRGGVEASELSGIDRFRAIGSLMYNTYIADALLDRTVYLHKAGAVAQTVSIHRLGRPRGHWCIDALVDKISTDSACRSPG